MNLLVINKGSARSGNRNVMRRISKDSKYNILIKAGEIDGEFDI